jgi:hypothetical protein
MGETEDGDDDCFGMLSERDEARETMTATGNLMTMLTRTQECAVHDLTGAGKAEGAYGTQHPTGLAKARLITKSVINGLSLSLSLLVLVNYYYYSFTTTEVFA